MKRAGLVLAALLAAGLLTVAVAYATTVRDRDDVTVGFDIAKASSTHNRTSDELVATVDTYEPFAPSDFVTKDRPPSSVCIEIWTTNKPGEATPNYEACASANATGKSWKASLARTRKKGPQLRIGAVKVEQPSDTRLVMRFDPDMIHRPASYRWRAETTSFASDCKSGTGCPDYAPDRPDTAETRLGRPRT